MAQSLSADRMRVLAMEGARVRLEELRQEIASLEQLLRDSSATGGSPRRTRRQTRKRGKLSAAGRAAIVAAQKARWAKAKATSKTDGAAATPDNARPSAGARKRSAMSAAARKAVSVRMRKYWAARRKAAGKKTAAAAKS